MGYFLIFFGILLLIWFLTALKVNYKTRLYKNNVKRKFEEGLVQNDIHKKYSSEFSDEFNNPVNTRKRYGPVETLLRELYEDEHD